MAHDGSAGFSPEGWLPDRISVGLLISSFPPELVDQIVASTDTREQRRRLLPARLIVYFVMSLWLFRGPNCGYVRVLSKLVDALNHHRSGRQVLAGTPGHLGDGAGTGDRQPWRPPNVSSLARARSRLGAEPMRLLFDSVTGLNGGTASDDGSGPSCNGLRLVSVDAACADVPDTVGNNDFFGRPASRRGAGGFPQVRWVAAAESGTGALVGATIGPSSVDWRVLLRDLLPAFGDGMLVMAGHDLLSYALARATLATGANILWRTSSPPRPARVSPLADGSYLTDLHPRAVTDGPPITMRVIEFALHDDPARPTGVPEQFTLFTDLTDPDTHSALDLAGAYPARWTTDSVTRSHMTDMGEGTPALRSRDAEGVAQEMWALLAVYQAFRPMIGAADGTVIHRDNVVLKQAHHGRPLQ